ncbi:hypothetical protein [Mucilaginibacter sp.]|jgi:hypothetical protein|uniref:hypothetical protein n=1 Tax=Mucilaginibacter sp. TaxID=1882438 RepID=UPI003569E632
MITYENLIALGFKDPANNGMGCRISISANHEIAYYVIGNDIRYQTKGSGFTQILHCKNLEDIKTIYRILTDKAL